MKTLAALAFLALAGSASARELDATPPMQQPVRVKASRVHDDVQLGMKKEADRKLDYAAPLHDDPRMAYPGSI